jgi:hypothetical protein
VISAPGTLPVGRLTLCRDPRGRFSCVVEFVEPTGDVSAHAATLGEKHETAEAAFAEGMKLLAALRAVSAGIPS